MIDRACDKAEKESKIVINSNISLLQFSQIVKSISLVTKVEIWKTNIKVTGNI
jgi:hypothetical protein